MYEAKRTRQDARLVAASPPERSNVFRSRHRDSGAVAGSGSGGGRRWYGGEEDAHDQSSEGDEPHGPSGDGPT